MLKIGVFEICGSLVEGSVNLAARPLVGFAQADFEIASMHWEKEGALELNGFRHAAIVMALLRTIVHPFMQTSYHKRRQLVLFVVQCALESLRSALEINGR